MVLSVEAVTVRSMGTSKPTGAEDTYGLTEHSADTVLNCNSFNFDFQWFD